jgi:hypothetical protein
MHTGRFVLKKNKWNCKDVKQDNGASHLNQEKRNGSCHGFSDSVDKTTNILPLQVTVVQDTNNS